jgi:hypothetical protein
MSIKDDIKVLIEEAVRGREALLQSDRESNVTFIALNSAYNSEIKAYRKVLDLLDRELAN